jgi:2-phospho-L-lactate/phosphoenolpyruvate guanylyltransferase
MNCWAIIPVKASLGAKSRLAGVLDADQREALMRAMLGHVVAVAQAARLVDRIALVGPSRHGLPDDLMLLDDPGGGLNAALQSALAEVACQGASRLIVIAGDLPLLTTLDIDLLAAVPTGEIAIAPDRHGTGTNALSLPLQQAAGFAFAFGTDSFARHSAEAARLGLTIEVIRSAGLAKDIDVPGDLPDAAGLNAAIWI